MNEENPDCNGCLYDGELWKSSHGCSNCHAPRGAWYFCLKYFSTHPEQFEGDYDDY